MAQDLNISIVDTPVNVNVTNESVTVAVTEEVVNISLDNQGPRGERGPAGPSQGGTTPVHADIEISIARGGDDLSEVEVGNAFTNTYTVTVGPSGEYTFEDIGDATATTGTVSISGNIVTWTATAAQTPAAGRESLQFTVTYIDESDSDAFRVIRTQFINVGNGWFTGTSTSIPANNAALMDQGVFDTGDSVTLTGPGDAYIALPTRSAGYIFRSGVGILRSTTVSTTYSQGGYTLYDLGTLNSGETLTVEVRNG